MECFLYHLTAPSRDSSVVFLVLLESTNSPSTTKWVQHVAMFATSGAANAMVIQNIVIKAVSALQKKGAIVTNVVCDGHQTNKGVHTLFGISGKMNDVTNFILHPMEPDEKIYFLFDVPHIMKCIRKVATRFGTFFGTLILVFSAPIFSVSALRLSFSAPPPEVVLSIGITMSLTLNEQTPEEAAQYLEAAQRHSSRGSIPVMVEEPNIIPTPDDESEDGSEKENEGNSEKSERESEEGNEGNSETD
ncbi:hypothetical protein GHT06_005024 [Daphnia sinensis]|uniref:Transposable element P transposase-like RNase H domain-containing protein n=1 Tax=Daphnia sinensis TaxID=1820382 RepID=A0AAD5KWX2_9CRUS|nr:hypothetical protein GHT06_005024 [Daphnia sinensis]